jgi:phage/plasmid-associated DNA primase
MKIPQSLQTIELPHNWKLIEAFKTFVNLKYCITSNRFYLLQDNIWVKKPIYQVEHLFLKFLKTRYPNAYTQFNLNTMNKIIILLKRNSFSMVDCKKQANSKGNLIPFLNGVLNTKSLCLLPHSPNKYLTYIIPIHFNFSNTLVNTPMSKFLTKICNFNLKRLQVLRACLYCLFTNDLSNQIALFIYGTSGTGKNTFLRLLMFLVGYDTSLFTTINKLTLNFGLYSLLGKLLIVLENISLFKNNELQVISKIISPDTISPLNDKIKYLSPSQFIPSSFLIITSNVICYIKNAMTDLTQRIIYFPFNFKSNTNNKNLFNIIMKTNNNDEQIITGMIVPYLSAFIIWALTCPKEYVDILKLGGLTISNLISEDNVQNHPLHVWAKKRLQISSNSQVSIGNNNSDGTTLYGDYLIWARINGVSPINLNNFSNLLFDLLNSMKFNIKKKYLPSGLIIIGIQLNDKTTINTTFKLITNTNHITDIDFYSDVEKNQN